MDRLMLMAMGGYGDMGMMGGSTAGTGLIDSLKTKLSFLPEWAAILVIAGAGESWQPCWWAGSAVRLLARPLSRPG